MTLYRDIGYNTGDLQSRIDTLKRCKLYVKSAQMEQVESRKVAAGMITAVKEAYLQLLADRESAFNALCASIKEELKATLLVPRGQETSEVTQRLLQGWGHPSLLPCAREGVAGVLWRDLLETSMLKPAIVNEENQCRTA